MAGMTYMNLTCLGSTYSANIAGEIKRVDKAQPLAQYGSIFLFIIYYEIYTYVTYHGVGVDLLQAISKLNAAGADTAIFKAFPQIPYLLVYATQNPIAAAAGWTFLLGSDQLGGRHGSGICTGAEPVCLFLRRHAAAQDQRGQPPRFPGLCRAGRFIISWFQFSVNCLTPLLSAYQTYTITIWFFGWIFLSIAAIIFPWRRKDIWDKAPEVTRQKIFGAPGIVVAGVMGLIISVAAVWFTLVPSIKAFSGHRSVAGAAYVIRLLYDFADHFVLRCHVYEQASRCPDRETLPANSAGLVEFMNFFATGVTRSGTHPRVAHSNLFTFSHLHEEFEMGLFGDSKKTRIFFTTDVHGSTVVFKNSLIRQKSFTRPR